MLTHLALIALVKRFIEAMTLTCDKDINYNVIPIVGSRK